MKANLKLLPWNLVLGGMTQEVILSLAGHFTSLCTETIEVESRGKQTKDHLLIFMCSTTLLSCILFVSVSRGYTEVDSNLFCADSMLTTNLSPANSLAQSWLTRQFQK